MITKQSTTFNPAHVGLTGLFNSASGKTINITNPRAKDISLLDIAKGLTHNCQFGGQVNNYESAARHTLLVWFLAPHHLKPVALLFNASQAYTGSINMSLRSLMEPLLGPVERHLTKLIFHKYQVEYYMLPEIAQYANRATEIEYNYHHGINNEYMLMMKQIERILAADNAFRQLHNLLVKEFGQYDD